MEIIIRIPFVVIIFYTFINKLCLSASISGISTQTSALMYLTQYGYMDSSVSNPRTGALISAEAIRQSITAFQAFAHLPQTGQMDEQTLTMMSMPRCGVKDFVGFGYAKRKKRYALQGSRWRVRELTYKITKYPSDLSKGEVNNDITRAFEVWMEVTNLTFTEAVGNEKIHIEIRFESGEHGDGDPFDGPGATLAHAYFPIYGGDVHFDGSETWTVGTYKGTNLFQVSVHEIGHSIGLSHSDVRSALMAPFYRGYQPTFKLHTDDIQAIQSLYGKKSGKSPTPKKKADTPKTEVDTPSSADSSPLCTDPNPSIDVMVKMNYNGIDHVFVFKGKDYWRLTDDGVAAGFPRKIADDFPGLPNDLDAAFSWKDDKTYFFKGSEYWRLNKMVVAPDYPKKISKGFAGIPSNIQAAFVWSGNGKIYFFKKNNYWRFDPTVRPPVNDKYPKPMSNWQGLPDNIDDGIEYTNGFTYFFKGGQYWRFNDRTFKVDVADPPFPRPAGYWWFGCQKSQLTSGMQGDRGDIPLDPGTNDVSGSVDAVRRFIFGFRG